MLCADKPGTVVAVLIEVEFVGDTVLMQGGGIKPGMIYGHHCVLHRVPEEDGWETGLHLQLTGGLVDE